jgi:type I restriction enzyme R subunit
MLTEEELQEGWTDDDATHESPEDDGNGDDVLVDYPPDIVEPPPEERRKYYYDGGQVAIAAHLVYELDADGRQLRVVRYTDYAADKVRSLCPSTPELRARWSDPVKRSELIRLLEERGISFEELAAATNQPEADPFDLLCHLAYNAPLRTRRERAQRLKQTRPDFFAHYTPEARQVLEELLEKYAEHGDAQFVLPTCAHARRCLVTARREIMGHLEVRELRYPFHNSNACY